MGASASLILVHGAYHGAWCWERLRPRLEGHGLHVLAPDLPGHGADGTPPGQVNLAAYRNAVLGVIAEASRPVILVGHSMAGIVISAVAEAAPEMIDRLIYLTAYMLRNGENISAIAAQDRDSLVEVTRRTVEGAPCVEVSEAGLKRAFYHEASDADLACVASQVGPQPIQPFRDTLALSPERYGRVSRHYVLCRHDRAISPALQRSLIAAQPGTCVHEFDSGHSPFVTAPEALAGLLARLAADDGQGPGGSSCGRVTM